MTITNTTNKIREAGNGVKVTFSFPFKIFNASDLEVYKVTNADDTETLQTITTDYTVSINPTTEGGTVTYVSAPLGTEDSLIVRSIPQTQTSDLPVENNMPEETIENALDKAVMMIQELQEEINRSFKVSVGNTSVGLTVPTPVEGKALLWDASNNLKNSVINVDDIVTNGAAARLIDADGDTEVHAEKNTDEDKVRIKTGGTERLVVDSSGLTLATGLNIVVPSGSGITINGDTVVPIPLMSTIISETGSGTLASAFTSNYRVGCMVYRVDGDTIGVSPGAIMINGKLRVITTALTSAYTVPDTDDYLDVWLLADSAATAPTMSIADSGISPGGSSNPGTNGYLVGAIRYAGASTKINSWIQYFPMHIFGWDYFVGNDTAGVGIGSYTHGKTFAVKPLTRFSELGHKTSAPTDPGDLSGEFDGSVSSITPSVIATTTFNATARVASTLVSSRHYLYSFSLRGYYT